MELNKSDSAFKLEKMDLKPIDNIYGLRIGARAYIDSPTKLIFVNIGHVTAEMDRDQRRFEVRHLASGDNFPGRQIISLPLKEIYFVPGKVGYELSRSDFDRHLTFFWNTNGKCVVERAGGPDSFFEYTVEAWKRIGAPRSSINKYDVEITVLD